MVGIVVDGCSLTNGVGTGVVVERHGQVVTVAHTLRGARSVTVIARDGTEHPASVSAFDPRADLAIVDVATLTAPPLDVAESPIALGDASVVGWSLDRGVEEIEAEVTKRLVINIEDIYTDAEVERTGLEMRTNIEVGMSGGPVLTTAGKVAGIVYARSRGRDATGFATDAAELRSLLTERPLGDVERCR